MDDETERMAMEDSPCVDLPQTLGSLIPACRERLATIKREYGGIKLDSHTIQDVVNGSRGIKSLLWDVSKLDPDHGIRYRGFTIPQCFASIPPSVPDGHPLAEGVLWLLLTGRMPSSSREASSSLNLSVRIDQVPDHAFSCITALPISASPMNQLVVAIMALQTESQFAKAYSSGMPVKELWRPALEDCLNIVAQLPRLAAFIYRRIRRAQVIAPDPHLDFAANFCHMLGFSDPDMYEMMRMYMLIHCDHEGGAVSAHAVRLVGSTLADPYLAFAAGMNGCAGPLHGLAIQEAFTWIKNVATELGIDASPSKLEEYVYQELKAGRIIPGFGHALLKTTDSRYTCLYQFCEKKFPDDPYFKLLAKLAEVVPKAMRQQGKVRNPSPNVDAIIGVVFNHFGLQDAGFFPVILGVTRSLGCLSQLVWDRALGLPIERPSCVNMDWIEEYCKKRTPSPEK